MIVEHSMKWKSAYLNDHSQCVCLVGMDLQSMDESFMMVNKSEGEY